MFVVRKSDRWTISEFIWRNDHFFFFKFSFLYLFKWENFRIQAQNNNCKKSLKTLRSLL